MVSDLMIHDLKADPLNNSLLLAVAGELDSRGMVAEGDRIREHLAATTSQLTCGEPAGQSEHARIVASSRRDAAVRERQRFVSYLVIGLRLMRPSDTGYAARYPNPSTGV